MNYRKDNNVMRRANLLFINMGTFIFNTEELKCNRRFKPKIVRQTGRGG